MPLKTYTIDESVCEILDRYCDVPITRVLKSNESPERKNWMTIVPGVEDISKMVEQRSVRNNQNTSRYPESIE